VSATIEQQLQECAALREARSVLVRSAHVTLAELAQVDGRLRALLKGLADAGAPAAQLADAASEQPGVGTAFTSAALALRSGDAQRIAKVIDRARTRSDARRGLVSALGWVSAKSLRQVGAGWFATPDKFLRRLGMAACAVHRVDPGPLLAGAIEARDPGLRAVAAGCAGELGRLDMRDACAALLGDSDPRARMHGARSAVLLGDRGEALEACGEIALEGGQLRAEALPVAILAADRRRARALLERLARKRDENDPTTIRFLVYAVALAGDLHFMDWLISLMSKPPYARLAGEAFAVITGADLVLLDLAQEPPTMAAADTALAFEDDEGMAWPDSARVKAWWHAHKAGFNPEARHFLGTAPDAPFCLHVLSESRQRRRWVAALHLALGKPGSVLFNAAAPAWRQRRLLGLD
jgi:uncharacterized protein (TIGR02270 family)